MSEEIFRSVRMFLDLFKKAVKDQDGFSYTRYVHMMPNLRSLAVPFSAIFSESSKAAKKV
jgi:hypothetical protein